MATPATPARDRIAAITLAVLLHALVILPAVLLQEVGGRPGQGSRETAGKGEEVWIAVNFLEKEAASKPRPATIETPQVTVEIESPSASKSIQTVARAAADEKTQAIASPEDADEGSGSGMPEDDLDARYLAAMRAAVLDRWHAQGGGAIPPGCKIVFDQAAGGRALRAWVMQCADLPLAERIRLETAVMQQPLPYAGFEPVFREHFELVF